MIPSPWILLAVLLALAAAAGGGFYEGRVTGINAQKVADQASIDATNAALTAQKAEANKALQTALQRNADTLIERDRLKTQLGEQREIARRNTDALRLTGSLRFAAQDPGRGSGSGGPPGAPGDPAGHDGPAACVLSDAASSALAAIAYDADKLRDDYAQLYNWAHSK